MRITVVNYRSWLELLGVKDHIAVLMSFFFFLFLLSKGGWCGWPSRKAQDNNRISNSHHSCAACVWRTSRVSHRRMYPLHFQQLICFCPRLWTNSLCACRHNQLFGTSISWPTGGLQGVWNWLLVPELRQTLPQFVSNLHAGGKRRVLQRILLRGPARILWDEMTQYRFHFCPLGRYSFCLDTCYWNVWRNCELNCLYFA